MGLQARQDERSECPDGALGLTAFEAFFRDHYRVVVRLAQSVVGDSQAAQDVAQDVFLAAYRRFAGDYEHAAGWVRVAAVHTALNAVRGERRRDRRQRLVHEVGSLSSTEDTDGARGARRGPARPGAVAAPVGRGAGDAPRWH